MRLPEEDSRLQFTKFPPFEEVWCSSDSEGQSLNPTPHSKWRFRTLNVEGEYLPPSALVPAQGILRRMKKPRKVSSGSRSSSAARKHLEETGSSEVGSRFAVAIMAAGKGTRLKSQLPKVLHEVGGRPLLAHAIAAAKRVVPARDVYAIIGHEAERVRAALEGTGVQFVLQAEQRGTGHALMVAQEVLAGYDHVIVLSGDAPLITPETIGRLRNFHLEEQAAMTLLSADLEHPAGYGRVVRKNARSFEVQAIVEERAASAEQRKIREINSGFYVFAVKALYA